MKARFNEIQDVAELDRLIERSNEQPVVVFKHSTTCPISSGVYNEVSKADIDVNIIIVQNARDVSKHVAEKTGVRHESPQAIVLKNGKVVYHASHYDVTAQDLESNFKS